MEELYHHGIKGQKWGIRRYQNDDGTLTDAGRKRYSAGKISRELNKTDREIAKYVSRNAESRVQLKNGKLSNVAADKVKARIKANDALIRDGKKRVNELLRLSKEKGHKIGSKDVTRYTHTGRQIAANYGFGIIGNAALTGYDFYRAKKYNNRALAGLVEGKKYYVQR
jgi:hypothetical protein